MTTTSATIDLTRVRSVLCVPADDEERVRKARDRGADLVMFDLEDGVAPDRRHIAREILRRHIGPDVAIRICRWVDDLDLARFAGIVFVPKVEYTDQLPPWPPGSLVLCIESPSAVASVLPVILERRFSLAGLAFGRADFTAAVSGAHGLVDHAALQVAMTAHALGIHATDAPCYVLDDPHTLTAQISRSRRQGFTSKGCFCPSQIAAVNAGMRPSPAEIESARAILSSKAPGIKRTLAGVVSPPVLALAERITR